MTNFAHIKSHTFNPSESEVGGSQTYIELFRRAVRRTLDLLNSVERNSAPLNHEFDIVEDGWNWNNVKQPSTNPIYKVCFYFDKQDLALLDSCPFPCKFADNTNKSISYEYCGFAYPRHDSEMSFLEEWAVRFPRAEVCTYGQHLFAGGWKSGEVVRVLVDR